MTWTDLLFRMISALIAGGLIGLERQVHGRPAGLRTHILVSTGACIAVTAGIAATRLLPGITVDVGRMAAGIVTGVGFLGAGTIVHYREGVGGLTTAACIWFTAMTGLLSGFGFLLFAGLASIFALLVLVILELFEDRLPAASYWRLKIRLENCESSQAIEACRKVIMANRLHVKSSTLNISHGTPVYAFTLRSRFRKDYTEMVLDMNRIPGVEGVTWAHRTEEV